MHKSRTARRSRIGRYAYFLSYYIQSRLGRKRPLLGGMKITHACNLTCTHCPFWKKKAESLSFTQAISALFLDRPGRWRYVVSKGEEP